MEYLANMLAQRHRKSDVLIINLLQIKLSRVTRADRLQRESVNAASTLAATVRRQSPSSGAAERRRTFLMNCTKHSRHDNDKLPPFHIHVNLA